MNNIVIGILSLLILIIIGYMSIKRKEVYIYHLKDIIKTNYIELNRKDIYTNYLQAPIRDITDNIVGHMFSVNKHIVLPNGLNNVTTLTTYILPKGTIVCNLFYSTPNKSNNYLYGKIHSYANMGTGIYENKGVDILVEGLHDNDIHRRVLTLTF